LTNFLALTWLLTYARLDPGIPPACGDREDCVKLELKAPTVY
jgi:hypothetical protein